MRKIIIFALCIMFCFGFAGCESDSYKAFMSIESGTKTSWSQKHDFLEGTKGHVLNLGKEKQEMVIEVVTEEGSVDIIAKDQNGEIITEIENAETGTYNFSAEGKVKFRIYCEEHKGSVSVRKADS
ncbi:MAG: hypothetical protein IJO22_05850 [Oscillospiraceae bacterium]|nr:hypothetical protein [Oscillospiraceae bacterium]